MVREPNANWDAHPWNPWRSSPQVYECLPWCGIMMTMECRHGDWMFLKWMASGSYHFPAPGNEMTNIYKHHFVWLVRFHQPVALHVSWDESQWCDSMRLQDRSVVVFAREWLFIPRGCLAKHSFPRESVRQKVPNGFPFFWGWLDCRFSKMPMDGEV